MQELIGISFIVSLQEVERLFDNSNHFVDIHLDTLGVSPSRVHWLYWMELRLYGQPKGRAFLADFRALWKDLRRVYLAGHRLQHRVKSQRNCW